MTLPVRAQASQAGRPPGTRPVELPVPRGAALYIGALLGPGLLLLPGLAAKTAGPASILAWLALLGLSGLLAIVFAAFGREVPSASGAAGYAQAGLGRAAGALTRTWFLAGVVTGAPIVCLVGAGYVAGLTGGGQATRAAVAAAMLAALIALAAGGVRSATFVQLVLVTLLIAVIVVAVTGSATAARAANWAPFLPHGWTSVGRAASVLMLSFVGWEAVAPLTSRFADPDRQLPKVIGIAFAVTSLLYLGLAVAVVASLGRSGTADVPLARLLALAVGPAGNAVAAGAAVVLTLGSVNAYLSGSVQMTGSRLRVLPLVAACGLVVLGLFGLGAVNTAALVEVPTAMFVCVYVACLAAAVRLLAGRARLAAAAALPAVATILVFCGWSALPAVATGLAVLASGLRRRRPQLPGLSHSWHPRADHTR